MEEEKQNLEPRPRPRPVKKKKKKKAAPPPSLTLREALGVIGIAIKALLSSLWQLFYGIVSGIVARYMPSAHKRYMFVGIIFGFFLLISIGNIIYFLSSDKAAHYRAYAKKVHRPQAINIEPMRGTIYAADDRAVALTAAVYRMYFDFNHNALYRNPKNAKEQRLSDSIKRILPQELDKLEAKLAESFAQRGAKLPKGQRERWRKSYQEKRRYASVVDMDIMYQQYRDLLKSEPFVYYDSVKRKSYSGILKKILTAPEMRNKRFMPFGSLASRTIGGLYSQQTDSNKLSVGRYGLEVGFDKQLKGQLGKGMVVYAAMRENRIVSEPARDGYDVYTTLNMDLQSQLERIMRKQLGHFSAASGTAILLDVPTGQVLALTNLARTSSGGYIEAQNFAVADLSEPGSTFKVASMLVALDNGFVRPDDVIEIDGGLWNVGGRTVRDHNAHNGGYGRLTASEVIERSSNVGVAKIIHRNFASNPSEYVKQVRALGFGENLMIPGLDVGAARAEIRMPNKTNWYGTTLAWMSFGYETKIPPIYTAAVFNAIANGGKLMRPYIVRKVMDKAGNIIEEYQPQVVKQQIAKPSSIEAMQQMLRKVVTDGTGKKLNSKVVAVSGKSGTAQLAKNGSYRAGGLSHQVSFCGYFPSEAPRYTLMVVIREPSPEFSAGGGSMAGPVVKELAETIISMERPSSLDSIGMPTEANKRKHIARGRKNELMQLAQTLGMKYQPNAKAAQGAFVYIDSLGKEHLLPDYQKELVPNVLGMTAEDAHYLLTKRGYKVRLVGYGLVAGQSVPAGTHLAPPAELVLTLGATL